MMPKPVQSRIPIWIGGKVEPIFQRVADLGDGWLASSSTSAEDFSRGWEKINNLVQKAGRDLNTLTPAKFCYIHIDDTTENALATLNDRLPKYYGMPYDAARFSLYGPPARCIEGALKLLEAGIQTLIFATVTHDRTQLERLGREVLPKLNL